MFYGDIFVQFTVFSYYVHVYIFRRSWRLHSLIHTNQKCAVYHIHVYQLFVIWKTV